MIVTAALVAMGKAKIMQRQNTMDVVNTFVGGTAATKNLGHLDVYESRWVYLARVARAMHDRVAMILLNVVYHNI